MITRSTKNNKSALASRSFLMTAVAVTALSSASYAQTNSSSGINRRSATETAQSPASSPKTPVTTTPVIRAKAPVKAVAKTPAKKASPQRAVKITIRGDRRDVQQARQQGTKSLRDANAAVAARNAERQAAAAEAEANAQAANAQNTFQQPNFGYSYVPGGNPIAGYGAGLYGSVPTVQPFINGATPYGSPNVSFPSFYSNYAPYGGVGSSFSTYSFGAGNINPLSFYGF